MINEEKLVKSLNTELNSLDKSIAVLQESYKECVNITYPFSAKESVSVDALTIRLARSSDIYTQKILTAIIMLTKEKADGFIDKINLCEKLYIIDNADDMKVIRDLRNSVTHDYEGDTINKIFLNTLKYTPKLLANIAATKQYINDKL